MHALYAEESSGRSGYPQEQDSAIVLVAGDITSCEWRGDEATAAANSYAAAKQRLPELSAVDHQQVRATRRCNNGVEQAHQPTRIRERRMGRFRCAISAQRFLFAFCRLSNLFRPRRHLLTATQYHSTLQDRFATGRIVVGLPAA